MLVVLPMLVPGWLHYLRSRTRDEPLADGSTAASNRQKVSGMAGDPMSIASLHQRVELGIAIFNEREEEFFATLERQLDALHQVEPASSFPTDA